MTLGERIKKARRSLDLTQQKFADQIGTTQNNIASYEIGRREPSAAAINNICKTFNISEDWLRTGEGEMFVQRAEEDELAAAVERLVTGESAEFKRRLVNALSTLKDEHWLLLEQKLKEIVGMREAVPAFAPALDAEEQERMPPDLAAEVVELKRQNQELAAKVAAMEEEDARMEAAGEFLNVETFGGTKTG